MSKIEARKIQTILKELGHEIPLGHCYELIAKMQGHASWNVAAPRKSSGVPVVTAQVFETIRNEILEKYEFVGKCECCGIDTYRDPNGYNDPRGPLGLNAVSMIYASEYDKEGRDIVACFTCTNEEPKYKRLMRIAEENWSDALEDKDIIFKGIRDPNRNIVTVNGHPLPECLDILNKSPDGFEWGYGGSGPSQLALAISVHLVGKEMALKVYQDLKEKFISPIKADSFTLSGKEMRRFLQSCFASL